MSVAGKRPHPEVAQRSLRRTWTSARDCPAAASGPAKRSVTPTAIPAEVDILAPRMRSIATVIYRHGGSTARRIQDNIGGELQPIRTLLLRMEARGIVRRRQSGRRSEVFYLPAIIDEDVQKAGLQRLINEHFEGAGEEALKQALQLLSRNKHHS